MEALSKEEVWFTTLTVRSTVVNKIESGIEQLLDMLLSRFFNPDGANISLSGVSLETMDGERATIFARLGCLLADEPALKEMMGNKGWGRGGAV